MEYQFAQTLDHRKNNSFRWEQPEGRDDVIGMGTADMDYYCPPCIQAAMQKVLEENAYNYRKKPEEYYQAVTGWYRRVYGLEIAREWVTNVPGTLGAVRMALDVLAARGDYILMQEPYFNPLERAVIGAGCKLLTNPMKLKGKKYELDFEDFEEKIRQYQPSVFLMVNPQNPTGRVFTREELLHLVNICARNHVLIISDEVHSLITYDGHMHIPVLAVSETAQNISVQIVSMSKGFNMMGLQHALVTIANPGLRERWEQNYHSYSFGYASNAYCIAAVTSVLSGAADEWLAQVTEYLKVNRDEMIACIENKQLPITPILPEGGYLMWLDCRKMGMAYETLSKFFLEEAGISLNNGEEFGETGRGFVRINFGVTNANLKKALERIAKACEKGLVVNQNRK